MMDQGTPTMSGVLGANRRASSERVWYHFMFSTYGTWIRADERGFRDSGHRIHSSGDYRRPPPPQEHANLRKWVKQNMRSAPVRLSVQQRFRIGAALVRDLLQREIQLIILAVGSDHAHGIGRFPSDAARSLIGHAKRHASHALRAELPGQVWGKRALLKVIRSEEQQRATFVYIARHGPREGAWVWTFRDPVSGARALTH